MLLHKGLQWVQFDLQGARPDKIFAVVIWHAHDTPKVCRSVIVQAADDEDFTENVGARCSTTTATTVPVWALGPTGNTSRVTGEEVVDAEGGARVFCASIPTAAPTAR